MFDTLTEVFNEKLCNVAYLVTEKLKMVYFSALTILTGHSRKIGIGLE